MIFNTGAALLDAIVLAVVSREIEGTYGYKITQDVRKAIDVSESTLYPVLRRLQKDECLEVYDKSYDGRNRRYYKVTEKGMAQLNLYNGRTILARYRIYSKGVWEYEPQTIYGRVKTVAHRNIRRRKSGSTAIL